MTERRSDLLDRIPAGMSRASILRRHERLRAAHAEALRELDRLKSSVPYWSGEQIADLLRTSADIISGSPPSAPRPARGAAGRRR